MTYDETEAASTKARREIEETREAIEALKRTYYDKLRELRIQHYQAQQRRHDVCSDYWNKHRDAIEQLARQRYPRAERLQVEQVYLQTGGRVTIVVYGWWAPSGRRYRCWNTATFTVRREVIEDDEARRELLARAVRRGAYWAMEASKEIECLL